MLNVCKISMFIYVHILPTQATSGEGLDPRDDATHEWSGFSWSGSSELYDEDRESLLDQDEEMTDIIDDAGSNTEGDRDMEGSEEYSATEGSDVESDEQDVGLYAEGCDSQEESNTEDIDMGCGYGDSDGSSQSGGTVYSTTGGTAYSTTGNANFIGVNDAENGDEDFDSGEESSQSAEDIDMGCGYEDGDSDGSSQSGGTAYLVTGNANVIGANDTENGDEDSGGSDTGSGSSQSGGTITYSETSNAKSNDEENGSDEYSAEGIETNDAEFAKCSGSAPSPCRAREEISRRRHLSSLVRCL